MRSRVITRGARHGVGHNARVVLHEQSEGHSRTMFSIPSGSERASRASATRSPIASTRARRSRGGGPIQDLHVEHLHTTLLFLLIPYLPFELVPRLVVGRLWSNPLRFLGNELTKLSTSFTHSIVAVLTHIRTRELQTVSFLWEGIGVTAEGFTFYQNMPTLSIWSSPVPHD